MSVVLRLLSLDAAQTWHFDFLKFNVPFLKITFEKVLILF